MSESKFLSPLQVECIDDLAYSGRGIWRIINAFRYYSALLGFEIAVEPGFLTDFSSVPRAPILYWFCGDRAHLASVIHDWLYHHHEVCSEQVANAVFHEALAAQGIEKSIIDNLWLGVALGGRSSWEEDERGNGHTIMNSKIV